MVLGRRSELQTELETMLGTDEVYFQPPLDVQMVYPSIVYRIDPAYTEHADNILYRSKQRYEVTLMDLSPDTPVYDKLLKRRYCSLVRSFSADGVNHYVFDLYN